MANQRMSRRHRKRVARVRKQKAIAAGTLIPEPKPRKKPSQFKHRDGILYGVGDTKLRRGISYTPPPRSVEEAEALRGGIDWTFRERYLAGKA